MKKFLRSLTSSDNFEYFNAILRRRVSLLLDYDDYVTISKGDLLSFEQFLLDSRYAQSYRLEMVRSRRSILSRIEFAVAHRISAELNHSRKIAEGEVLDLFEVILAKADLLDSRLVLRSFYTDSHGSPEPLWHTYGTLPLYFFNDLWKGSTSISEAVEKCYSNGHPLALALASALVEVQQGYTLFHAERTLLIEGLGFLRNRLKKTRSVGAARVEEYLGMNVDLWNLAMWIRENYGKQRGKSANLQYIEGGACFSISKLHNSRTLRVLVTGTVWNGVLNLVEKMEPRDIQRAMHRQMMNWQRKLYRTNPLGIEVALGYVARYLTEWENLNLLAVGMASGVDPSELLKRIIPVD